MPGYNQATLNYAVQNANSTAIIVGDQIIGFGQTTSIGLDFGAEGLYGIGSALPQEIQQQKISITCSLNRYKLTKTGVGRFGETATWSEALNNTQLTFHLVGKAGSSLLTVVGATCNNFSTSVTTNQAVTEETSFMALDILGPDGKSIIDSANTNTANAFASLIATAVIDTVA